MTKKIGVGIIGFGTVGTGVVRILKKNSALIRQRAGVGIDLKAVADIDIKRDRGVDIDPHILTTRAMDVVNHPDIDIVVELIGGTDPARSLVLGAIANGKSVVTANKALLAEHGYEIVEQASRNAVEVAFEASVGGGIPIIRAVRDGFSSDRIVEFFGIVNGTANYILSRMTDEHAAFHAVLKDAQRNGYAEADPSFDIEGIDTLHKLAVLISLAYGKRVDMKKIYTEGISRISPADIEFARELGYRIKLLAICRGTGKEVDARVHPTLIPENHMLSRVNGSFNAVFVQSTDVGSTMFYGRGAGMMPTASAVVADIVDVAGKIPAGVPRMKPVFYQQKDAADEVNVRKFSDVVTRYYLRFSADDRPGVLSHISGILGKHNISIDSVVQRGREVRKGAVPLFMLTHEAKEFDLQKALKEASRLSCLREETMVIRIEDGIVQT